MTVVLVGEQLGPGSPGRPLEGRVGRRLAALAGLSFESYLRLDRRNLWRPGERRTRATAVAAVARLIRTLPDGSFVVLLGRAVANAFRLEGYPPLSVVALEEDIPLAILLLPHPSGLNRWYNDHQNAEAAAEALRAFIKSARSRP